MTRNFVTYTGPLLRAGGWLWAGRSGFGISISGGGWKFFSSPPRPDRSGTYPGSYPIPGVKLTTPPPSSVEVKNAWRYTSIPQYVFIAWCLVKHRNKFTFTGQLILLQPG